MLKMYRDQNSVWVVISGFAHSCKYDRISIPLLKEIPFCTGMHGSIWKPVTSFVV